MVLLLRRENCVLKSVGTLLFGVLAASNAGLLPAQPATMSGGSPADGPPATLAADQPVSAEHQRLAAQVVQSWNPDATITGNAGVSAQTGAVWAEPLLHDLDPNNARWNANHPQWGAMREIIVTDITPDLDGQLQALQSGLSESMARDMAQRLSEPDLTQLLHYFQSPVGRRFIAFQARVTGLFGSSMRAALQHEQLQPPAQPPPEDVLKARLQLLMLSSTAQITQSWLEEAQRTQADTSGFQAIGFIAAAVAVREGEQLDALHLQYASDLERFDGFNRSPLGKRFFAAFGEASKSVGMTTANALRTFQRTEEAKYGERWKRAYQVSVPPAAAAKP
jgi:hypothetical protein